MAGEWKINFDIWPLRHFNGKVILAFIGSNHAESKSRKYSDRPSLYFWCVCQQIVLIQHYKNDSTLIWLRNSKCSISINKIFLSLYKKHLKWGGGLGNEDSFSDYTKSINRLIPRKLIVTFDKSFYSILPLLYYLAVHCFTSVNCLYNLRRFKGTHHMQRKSIKYRPY